MSIQLNTIAKVGKIADSNLLALEETMKVLEKKLLLSFSDASVTQTVDVALARAKVEAILVEAGVYERIDVLLNDEYSKVLDEAYSMYNKMYPGDFQKFSGDSLARLDSLKQLDFTAMAQVNDALANSITKGIVNYQYGALSRQGVLDLITAEVGKSGAYLRTQFDTALSGYFQESANLFAIENGLDKFMYQGPEDKLTRPFCAHQMTFRKPMTREEIDALDNGQGLPVFQFGGGFNCRHYWIAVRDE